MTQALSLPQRVAAEVRAEMAWQKQSIHGLAAVLGVQYKAAKERYDGEREFALEELPSVADWLHVSITQLTTGRRDRDLEAVA